MRGILKSERRTEDGERDARAVVNVSLVGGEGFPKGGADVVVSCLWQAVEEYLPLLSSIVNCLGTDDLLLQADPRTSHFIPSLLYLILS